MLGSDGIPVDPLKHCAAPGQTKLAGGVPMHPVEKYLDQKGGGGYALESMDCPGAAQGFRGSTEIPSEPSIYPEYW